MAAAAVRRRPWTAPRSGGPPPTAARSPVSPRRAAPAWAARAPAAPPRPSAPAASSPPPPGAGLPRTALPPDPAQDCSAGSARWQALRGGRSSPPQRPPQNRNPTTTACAAAPARRLRGPPPPRRNRGPSATRRGAASRPALQATSSLVRLEPHQCNLEIAGGAKQVHGLHQVAVGDRLVGAQKDALGPVSFRHRVERGLQGCA